ncbi:hypothetical protein E3P99_00201 [Wallemia hederae]|uniref:Response regulatory domain-containing protein n=1 Tax=Wallemia hederae TaxID=1540922 RepID=A0A4T0FYJ8_9BASI|nr:hypothetical protein E3P99_00201 [Wallemia hederae]
MNFQNNFPVSGYYSNPNLAAPAWSTGWSPNQAYADGSTQPDQLQQSQATQPVPMQVKQEDSSLPPPPGNNNSSGPSDFVKKLFMMLEDSQYASVVCWSPSGESFVVKEMNDFTKQILPRHFKHSNFASFVRQLNKYDFHKVKREEGEEKPWGDQTWEFRHPEFKAHCRHLLENIKRKAPTGKGKPTAQQQNTNAAQELQNQSTVNEIANIQQQIETLGRNQQESNFQLNNLESNYNQVVNGIMTFQRSLINQDQHMQNILQHLIEQDLKRSGNFVQGDKVNTLISNYKEASSSSFSHLNDLNTRIAAFSQRKRATSQSQPPPQPTPPMVHGPQPQSATQGLKVFTFGQLRQRDGENGVYQQPPSAAPQVSNLGASTSIVKQEAPEPTVSVQKPEAHWTVPPRVLLVEDDAVCRKLSSKFLQIFGCTIDVADDGVSAVNKMNYTKYDLVLMDIVMPNLDGVAATNLIRQFDPMTPIISMTSNSNPNDILNYFSHGMNDILPKPFTKEGLFGMVEKHLLHLKTMQQLCEVPRALGLPPLNDQSISEALQSTAQAVIPNQSTSSTSTSSSDSKTGNPATTTNAATANTSNWQGQRQNQNQNQTEQPTQPVASHQQSAHQDGHFNPATLAAQAMTSDDGETVNPLASMGMSDENYVNMLQGILASGAMDQSSNYQSRASPVAIATAAAKRAMDDESVDGHTYKKKGRFEELID